MRIDLEMEEGFKRESDDDREEEALGPSGDGCER